ncbi:uncharacterized protein LOC135378698 [Ornithodoros turicata]|uniref:uncharacterized protein LOC135378698 n=1 Tax=Ornithodoros turicata TaxID=34597 RepID=UPI00313A0BD1
MPPKRRLKQYLYKGADFKVPRQTKCNRRKSKNKGDCSGSSEHGGLEEPCEAARGSNDECASTSFVPTQESANIDPHSQVDDGNTEISPSCDEPGSAITTGTDYLCSDVSGDITHRSELVGDTSQQVNPASTCTFVASDIGSLDEGDPRSPAQASEQETEISGDDTDVNSGAEDEDVWSMSSDSDDNDDMAPPNSAHAGSAQFFEATDDNLHEDLNSELSNSTLPGSQTTVAAAIVMVMAFVVGHGLSWIALQDLLTMINSMFGSTVLPPTLYLFRKLWAKKKQCLVTYHYYCSRCETVLNEELHCNACMVTYTMRQLRAAGCFFVITKIAKQIKHHIEVSKSDLLGNLQKLAAQTESNDDISDITSAAAHRKLRQYGTLNESDLTITFNTDGSPLYESSKTSIWPIQFTINELPPQSRFKSPILAGLWFGKSHPKMSMFLSKFVDEVNSMQPVQWVCGGITYTSKVYALCCCVDAPARAAVQNYVLFNGYFGCPWCLTKGTYSQGSMRYLYEDQGRERTPGGVIRDANLAVELNTVINGIKGPSPLLGLHGFDPVWGFTVDYMHCVLQGVARQFAELWFGSCHSEERFYIGSPVVVNKVNQRLLLIRPPHCFTRLPRIITERNFWKASEWRLWVLFYALPCTLGLLPERYWRHFSKLSEALHLLLSERITPRMMCRAEQLLMQFVSSAASLYGDNCMKFNMHQLLHLTKAARQMGPLWAHSAFVFEGGNGSLVKLVKASKGVPQQIVERVVLSQELHHFLAVYTLPTRITAFCKSMLGEKRLQSVAYVGSICLLGKAKATTLTMAEKHAVTSMYGACQDVVNEYTRAVYKDQVYHSEAYSRAVKSNSAVVRTATAQYYVIRRIIVVRVNSDRKCLLLCKEVLTMDGNFPPHINECFVDPVSLPCVVDVLDVNSPSLFINFAPEERTFICDLPNVIERD